MKAVIMAGGRGSRIASVAGGIPKPMIRIGNKPVLEHEVECLAGQGYRDIIITVSYLADKIIDYFGDGSKISPATGRTFGVKIEYFVEEEPLGSAGALLRLKDRLAEDFLLLNADSIFQVDFDRFIDFHRKKGGLVTLFTHPNSHPYDSGLIIADKNGVVEQWISKEEKRPVYYRNRVNAGLHIVSPKVLDNVESASEKVDLDRQLLKPLAGTGKMFAYDSPEYVKDMGTPERYQSVCRDFESGKVWAKSLKNKQKAVFLDRDGTINKYVGFLRNIDEFELLPGVCEAVKRINEAGYLAVVVTNQPVIARGEVTFGQLEMIHHKMETLLGLKGAYVDALYYCPHHPDKGYEGERAELKVDCGCRKPKPGMLLRAAEEYHIDLAESWIVGDSKTDIQAGKAAGCRTALICRNNDGTGQGSVAGQDVSVDSLYQFARRYLP